MMLLNPAVGMRTPPVTGEALRGDFREGGGMMVAKPPGRGGGSRAFAAHVGGRPGKPGVLGGRQRDGEKAQVPVQEPLREVCREAPERGGLRTPHEDRWARGQPWPETGRFLNPPLTG